MKVLIVEDDKNSRFFLESLLESNGYDFRLAKDGMEGLNIFEEYEPDVVLSDIQMPIMDGLELLEEIKNKRPQTIVIIVTAFGSENYAIQSLQLKANNYLKKPVSGQDILRLLKKYQSIITNKFSAIALPGTLINRKLQLKFDTEFNNIPKIVDRIIVEADLDIDDGEKVNIELGLVELITNAVEHGNLNINFTEKQNALDKNSLDKLYLERLKNLEYKQKCITVDFFANTEKYEWTISDEGNGFDWQNLPNPTDDKNILNLNGRGIFICRFLFDEIKFTGNGNTVIATKFIKNLA